jgi:hypothetical protein
MNTSNPAFNRSTVQGSSLPVWMVSFWIAVPFLVVVHAVAFLIAGRPLAFQSDSDFLEWLLAVLVVTPVVVYGARGFVPGFLQSNAGQWCVQHLASPRVMLWTLYGIAAAWFTVYLFFPWDSFIPLLLLLVVAGVPAVPLSRKFGIVQVARGAWVGLLGCVVAYIAVILLLPAIGFHPWREHSVETVLAVVVIAGALFKLSQKWGVKNVLGYTVSGGLLVLACITLGFLFVVMFAAIGHVSYAHNEDGFSSAVLLVSGIVFVFFIPTVVKGYMAEQAKREAHKFNPGPVLGPSDASATTHDLKAGGWIK